MREKVALIVDKYKRRKLLTVYLSGGLGGLGLFGAGDLAANIFSKSPALFAPLFITFALTTAILFAFSYVGYEWQETLLLREFPKEDDRWLTERVWKPPARTEICYRAGFIFLGATGTCLLFAAWWPYLPTFLEVMQRI
ncbi:hypothetical protein ACQEVF_54120 [Nonomuraea polychroma]|uniref:hypothetical protein n=1 Tax=Nonomuraea polychroma TaxID=46176 RepID=UPI003D8D02FA